VAPPLFHERVTACVNLLCSESEIVGEPLPVHDMPTTIRSLAVTGLEKAQETEDAELETQDFPCTQVILFPDPEPEPVPELEPPLEVPLDPLLLDDWLNVAETEALLVMLIVQAPVPVHDPLHPANVEFELGVAVSVTDVPVA
jgi:hypothetical protein